MTRIEGEYIPSTSQWVRDQIDLYERTDGREGASLLDTGIPVIIVTMRGARTGAVRKIALMRVEHDGSYALVASKGGAPDNPNWYANLLANPTEVTVQDGPEPHAVRVREIDGAEYDQWWQRSVSVFPRYEEYRAKTDRRIPVLVAEPV
ncbi:MAG: nitroreductase family deazaflavin-dependent oxidoreductase [Actinomycetota bacterium]